MSPSKLELLAIQASIDERGRIPDRFGVTIACTETDRALWIGAAVPDGLVPEISAIFERSGHTKRTSRIPASEPPPVLVELARFFEDHREPSHPVLERKAGPSYRIDPEIPLAVGVHFESNPARLRDSNPGNWDPVEWTELIEGKLGPWTLATVGTRVASICHTPGVLTPQCAEAGVWTHPDYRGRGFAAATTAAWTRLVRAPGRYLFYSTDTTNSSSQRVAQRLRFELLGFTWRLAPARIGTLHPLCSARGTEET